MKRLAVILFAFMTINAVAADTTIKGHLVDIACAREDGQKADFGAKHTKECLKMRECVESGYGVLTADKKLITIDKAGNDQVKKFLDGLKKESDIKVVVTGTLTGGQIVPSKIELQ
jgi:hypothetical protein